MIPDFDRTPSELSPADAATCVAQFSFLKAPLGAAVVLISKQMAPKFQLHFYLSTVNHRKVRLQPPVPRSSAYCPISSDFHSTRVFNSWFCKFLYPRDISGYHSGDNESCVLRYIDRNPATCVRSMKKQNRPVCVFGPFAKLRKATVSFTSARMFVHTEQIGSHWTDFHEI